MSDWDVTINSVNYMLQPKSYKSRIVGGPPGHTSGQPATATVRTARLRLTDFATGQGYALTTRASANNRGGLLSGQGAFPAPYPAQLAAIGNHPARQAITTGFATGTQARYHAVGNFAGTVYFFEIGPNRDIYRWTRAVGSAPTQRNSDIGADCTGLAYYNGKLYIGLNATDLKTWVDNTSTLATFAAGRKAYGPNGLITHGGGIFAVDAADKLTIRAYSNGLNTNTQQWLIQGAHLNWASAADGLIIATTNGLMKMTGTWLGATNTFALASWGSIAPYQSNTDDFAWMVVFQGRVFTWAGKTVIWYDDARDTWRHSGLEGETTYGAAVVQNILYVAMKPWGSSNFELWAYTGSGWWRVESNATNVFANIAADGDGKLVTRQAGSTASSWAIDLEDRNSATDANTISPVELITPAMDWNEPDREKTITRVGVETLRNDGQVVGTWSVAISTSVDGGQTWVSAGSAESVTDEVETIDYAVSLTANQLMLKVVMTRTSGLPPHIIAIWAEATWSEDPPAGLTTAIAEERRREWEIKLPASDDIINRAGAADARTGQEIRTALWALWPPATSIQYRDVDYGATAAEHTVRVVDIAEEWPHPADQPNGAHSVVTLTLQEV